MILTSEPEIIVAGGTADWTKRLPDYPPSAGYTIKYEFRGPSTLDITGTTQDDNTYAVHITPVQSAALQAGLYVYRLWALLGTNKYWVGDGRLQVDPDFSTLASYDGRTKARRILDAVDACLENKATTDQYQFVINGRELRRYHVAELISLREYYAVMVQQENLRERVKAGKSIFRHVQVKFTGRGNV